MAVPEAVEKIGPGEDVDGAHFARAGVLCHEDQLFNRILFREGQETLSVAGVGHVRGFYFHGNFVVSQNKVHFQLGGRAPVKEGVMYP